MFIWLWNIINARNRRIKMQFNPESWVELQKMADAEGVNKLTIIRKAVAVYSYHQYIEALRETNKKVQEEMDEDDDEESE